MGKRLLAALVWAFCGTACLAAEPEVMRIEAKPEPVEGTTIVQITTDYRGKIASVVILKSAGNRLLDDNTVNYVRANWRGPANSSKVVTFKYVLRGPGPAPAAKNAKPSRAKRS